MLQKFGFFFLTLFIVALMLCYVKWGGDNPTPKYQQTKVETLLTIEDIIEQQQNGESQW